MVWKRFVYYYYLCTYTHNEKLALVSHQKIRLPHRSWCLFMTMFCTYIPNDRGLIVAVSLDKEIQFSLTPGKDVKLTKPGQKDVLLEDVYSRFLCCCW